MNGNFFFYFLDCYWACCVSCHCTAQRQNIIEKENCCVVCIVYFPEEDPQPVLLVWIKENQEGNLKFLLVQLTQPELNLTLHSQLVLRLLDFYRKTDKDISPVVPTIKCQDSMETTLVNYQLETRRMTIDELTRIISIAMASCRWRFLLLPLFIVSHFVR